MKSKVSTFDILSPKHQEPKSLQAGAHDSSAVGSWRPQQLTCKPL